MSTIPQSPAPKSAAPQVAVTVTGETANGTRTRSQRYFIKRSADAIIAEARDPSRSLKKTLGSFDLIVLGIGMIIGTGIFVLAGIGAASAGPGIILSFVVAGVACGLAGLCYAELASTIPTSGSAYVYTYTAVGELVGWILAWALVLEYAVGAIAVSIGWSGYMMGLLRSAGIVLPTAITAGPFDGGVINLPAVLIVAAVGALLIRGAKESARVTSALVILKVAIIVFVIALGLGIAGDIVGGQGTTAANFIPNLTTNFMPFGFAGVMAGAAVIFFAYIGFDSVSTMAEETKDPKRALPIGILGSLAICTALYILAASVLMGLIPYQEFVDARAAQDAGTMTDAQRSLLTEPFAHAFRAAGLDWAANIIAAGAIAGITSVLMVLLMGGPRILFSLSRDGLIPERLAKVHPKFGTPYLTTALTAGFVALGAAFITLGNAAHVTNVGTLFAFLLVCVSVLVLRRQRPDIERPFRVPWSPLLPAGGALACGALMMTLFLNEATTLFAFLGWMGIGLMLYALYGIRHSRLANKGEGSRGSGAEVVTEEISR